MIHSSYYKPRVFPIKGDTVPPEIDRAQAIDPTVSLNREKIEELGRDGVVGYLAQTPGVGITLTQREYGSLEFFEKLANVATSTTSLTLNSFKTPYFDICAYLEDDDGNFDGTVWYPNQRLSGFTITIGSPEALIDRSFTFAGEQAKILTDNNKYFVYIREVVNSGELVLTAFAVTLDDPTPTANPDSASETIFRVVRVRSGVSTELTYTTDFTYAAGTLTVLVAALSDVYKIYYSAATYISGEDYFTENDTDLAGILANSASLYLGSSNYLYKVQSATIDVRFDREDVREIGNENVVVRGIRNRTVTVTLGKLLDSWTIEEVLRGESVGYGLIDVKRFSTDLTFIAAIYDDSDKETFKIGYTSTSMTPSDFTPGTGNIDQYVNSGVTLEGEELTIADNAAEIGL